MEFEEGYVKFKPEVDSCSVQCPLKAIEVLNYWRQKIYNLGLIGVYPNGIGYGNISCRYQDRNQFIISGTATGRLAQLNAEHYTLVTKVEATKNQALVQRSYIGILRIYEPCCCI